MLLRLFLKKIFGVQANNVTVLFGKSYLSGNVSPCAVGCLVENTLMFGEKEALSVLVLTCKSTFIAFSLQWVPIPVMCVCLQPFPQTLPTT